MHLIHVVSGTLSLGTVLGDSAPNLILYHQHADLFKLLTELLDVIAHKSVGNIYIGPVIEHIERTTYIDFKSCCHMPCFRLILLKECIIQIL